MGSSSIAANASPVPSASLTRRWSLALALCTLACLLSARFVDRPVADFVQAHLRHTTLYAVTNRVLSATLIVPPLSFAILVTAGWKSTTGGSLPSWMRTLVLCSWGITWALAAAIMFKIAIGRTSPDPVYVIDRVYDFRFLGGGPGREAFPSATTAVAAALLSILWMRSGKYRAWTSLAFGLVALALVVTNSHWVSDIIGGAFLGAMIGASTYSLIGRSI